MSTERTAREALEHAATDADGSPETLAAAREARAILAAATRPVIAEGESDHDDPRDGALLRYLARYVADGEAPDFVAIAKRLGRSSRDAREHAIDICVRGLRARGVGVWERTKTDDSGRRRTHELNMSLEQLTEVLAKNAKAR